jgi:hypothetical protein
MRWPLDQRPVTRGSAEEKYRSDPLDLSVEDQQSLDPEINARRLKPLDERRRVDLSKSRSPEVIRDRPSSRLTGGTRSTTPEKSLREFQFEI